MEKMVTIKPQVITAFKFYNKIYSRKIYIIQLEKCLNKCRTWLETLYDKILSFCSIFFIYGPELLVFPINKNLGFEMLD